MALSKKRVILVLTPASIDAAVLNGNKVIRADRVELDPALWTTAWDEGLVPMDQALASLLRRLQAADKPEVVVYTDTPTDLIDVNAFAGDASTAIEAALLSAGDKMDQANCPAPPVARALWMEQADEIVQSHVLTAFDADETLQKLFGWLRRAGGHLAGVVPFKAPLFEEVVARLRASNEEDAVVCYIGETCTAFGGKSNDKLAFIRAIDLGVQSLAEAYSRVLARQTSTVQPEGEEDAASVLSAGELCGRAIKLVYEQGIPTHNGGDKQNPGDLSREALPLLAPVFQRMCIEIKQTVRYGMPFGHQSVKKIYLVGPGAHIPGLARMLQSSLEMSVEMDQGTDSAGANVPFADGTTGGLTIKHDDDLFSLLPKMAIEQAHAKKRGTALRIGVLLAVALLAGEFGYTKYQQGVWDARGADQAAQLESVRAQAELLVQVNDMGSQIMTASFVTQDTLGDRADWYSLMAEMARLAVDPIELTEFRMFYENGTPVVSIGGFADQSGTYTLNPKKKPLGAFIDQLTDSPLFSSVQLGSTSSEEHNGRMVKRFSAQLGVHAFPVQYVIPEMPMPVNPDASVADGGPTP